MRNFYKTLYKKEFFLDKKRQDEILKNTKLPKLSNDLKNKCDSDHTEIEITKALNNTKNDMSPGSDGLSPDFYKKFWGQLSKDFTEMTNAILNRKLLTPPPPTKASITDMHIQKWGQKRDSELDTNIQTKHRLQTDNKNADKQIQTDAAAHNQQTPDSMRP